MSYLGKIVKNTVIMFAVGAALAAAAPFIAGLCGFTLAELGIVTATGATAAGHTALWTGAFFGAFGGIHAAIEPIVNKLVGDKPRHTVHEKSIRTSPVIIAHGASLGDEVAQETTFQDKVAAGNVRVGQGSFADKVVASQNQTQEHSV